MSPTADWLVRGRQLHDGVREVWRAYQADRGPLAGAAVAFYLTVSVIPLGLFVISLATYLVPLERVQSYLDTLTSSFGPGVGSAVNTELLTVIRLRGLLTGVTLLAGLWAGSQVFLYIQAALDQVWDIEERRPLVLRYALALFMVLVTGALLLIAFVLVALIRVIGTINLPRGWEVQDIHWLMALLINIVLPLLLAFAAFAISYHYLPPRRVRWAYVLPGALLAAVGWVAVLHLLSWFAAHVANYTLLYGSLGGLVLLLLWFNYSAQLMVLGAEVCCLRYHHRVQAGIETEPWWEETRDGEG